MSDTPESYEHDQDYQTSGRNQISGATLDFCRKLERERDEALEQRDGYQLELQIVIERLKGNRHPDDNGMIYEGEIDIKAMTEQWDRLAGAVDAATTLIAAKGRHNTMLAYEGLRKALESLTTTKP